MLVATGRPPNADGLDLDRTGVLVDDEGIVVVDEHQRTAVEGIWALGDVANHYQLKHVANLEARVVQQAIRGSVIVVYSFSYVLTNNA